MLRPDMRLDRPEAIPIPVRVRLPGGLWPGDGAKAPLREVEMRAIADADQFFALDTRDTLSLASRATALLARCMAGGEDAAQALTIGDREALLLHLRRLTFGETMECVLRCPVPACDARMELSLQVADLLVPAYSDVAKTHRHQAIIDGAGCAVEFRLPTALDLDAVAALSAQDAEQGAAQLLRRCVIRADRDGITCNAAALPAEVCEAVAEAMSELDPQAELELDLSCPSCHAEFSVVFDAASFLLQEIDRAATRVLHEVHVLASRYGWSEDEILRIPAGRRARYIALAAIPAAATSPARAQSRAQ
jgi:hypothetical protein